MSLRRRAAVLLGGLALMILAVGPGTANADPVQHFDTFVITCGADTLVIVSKPGASNVVTINGMPSNSVSILKGFTFIVDGQIVEEFHKPWTSHHEATICTEVGTTEEGLDFRFVAEVLNTPRGN